MRHLIFGEFFGTLVLIVLGDGVVAGVLLNKTKSHAAGWITVTAGWALAVFAGVAVSQAFGDTDAHLNPAITVASVFEHRQRVAARHLYSCAACRRIRGRGAGVDALHAHWAVTESADLKFACFATSPAIPNRVWNFFSEVLATFILVLVATALFSKRVAPGGLAPG